MKRLCATLIGFILLMGWMTAFANGTDGSLPTVEVTAPRLEADKPWADTRGWSQAEVAVGALALTAHVVDWGTSRDLVKTGYDRGMYETNWQLGRHPSLGRMNTHFVGTGVLLMGLAHFLPEWRLPILGVWAAVEVGYVYNNFNMGLRVSF